MCQTLCVVLVVLSPLVCAASDPKIGDRVFLKPDAEAIMNGKKNDVATIPVPATVMEVKGEKVFLGKAWVGISDVTTDVVALEYYSQAVQKEPKNSRFWLSRGLVLEHYRQPENIVIGDGLRRSRPLATCFQQPHR